MLGKKEILAILKYLNLPKDSYYVGSGAALVLQGVKEKTHDVDITCTKRILDKYRELGYKAKRYEIKDGVFSNIIDISDEIQLIEDGGYWPVGIIEIEGYPIADLKSVRYFKDSLGREKDILDIELINRYLKNLDLDASFIQVLNEASVTSSGYYLVDTNLLPSYFPTNFLTKSDITRLVIVYAHWLQDNNISFQNSNVESFNSFKNYLLRLIGYSGEKVKQTDINNIFRKTKQRNDILTTLFSNIGLSFSLSEYNKDAFNNLRYQESVLGQFLLSRSNFDTLLKIDIEDIKGYTLQSITPLYLYNINTKEDIVRFTNILLKRVSKNRVKEVGWDYLVFELRRKLGVYLSLRYDWKNIAQNLNLSVDSLKILYTYLFDISLENLYNKMCPFLKEVSINKDIVSVTNECNTEIESTDIEDKIEKQSKGYTKESLEKIRQEIEEIIVDKNSFSYMTLIEYFISQSICDVSKEMFPKSFKCYELETDGLFKQFIRLEDLIFCLKISLKYLNKIYLNKRTKYLFVLNKWHINLKEMLEKRKKIEAEKLNILVGDLNVYISNIRVSGVV